MQNEAISPGGVICEAALAGAIHVLKTNGRSEDATITKLALASPNFTRPLTNRLVGMDGEIHTTITLPSQNSDKITVSWQAKTAAASEKKKSYDLGTCEIVINQSLKTTKAGWDRITYFIKSRMDDTIRDVKEGHGHRFQSQFFFTLFSPYVDYDEEYKGVKEAFISGDFSEAAAEVFLSEHPKGSSFAGSPYWGEITIYLAGFLVNVNPNNKKDDLHATTFIASGFERFEQTHCYEPGKSYLVYTRVSQTSDDTRRCDVYIFDGDKLVAQCINLKFHGMSSAVLRNLLSKRPETSSSYLPQNAASTHSTAMVPTHKEPALKVPISSIPTPSSSVKTFQVMLQIISEETGILISELIDDVSLVDIGVDSIMAIEITSAFSSSVGIELTPSVILNHDSIAKLRTYFAADVLGTPSSEGVMSSFESLDTPSQSITSSQTDSEKLILVDSTGSSIHEEQIEESIPLPTARVTLLHNGKRRGRKARPPLYMIADGTGSISVYIHLPGHIKSEMNVYGIDSPFLRCPNRFTTKLGIPGVAKIIVDALVQKQPEGEPFYVGGFSGGAMVSYEVVRQLHNLGRKVDGLLLIDMCSPRRMDQGGHREIGLAMFDAVSAGDDSGV